MSLQNSPEYRGGFFDVLLAEYIFKEDLWNKGIPKIEPPSATYYKPRIEINQKRPGIYDDISAFFKFKESRSKGRPILLLRDSGQILKFFDEIESDLVFMRPLTAKMRQFLTFRVGRTDPWAQLTSDEKELYDKYYKEFEDAKGIKIQTPFIPSPARLAGMVDASRREISISRALQSDQRTWEHKLTVGISCDHPGFIEGMKQEYGGGLSNPDPDETDETGSGWEGSEGTAGKVLIDAFPHLILRKAQAGLGLDYLAATKLFDRRTILPFDRRLKYTQGDIVDLLLDGFIYNMRRLNEADLKK